MPEPLRVVDGNASTVTYALRDLDGQVLREISGPIGTTVQHRKDFVHGAEGLVATCERGGLVRYFHKDHLGSPRLITDAGQGIDDEHAAERILLLDDGTVDVSRLTAEDIANNEGAALIHDLATSEDVYVYSEGTTVDTATGTRPTDSSIENLDRNSDWRFSRGRPASRRPATGVDSAVVIDPASQFVDDGTKTQQVSLAAVAFHELSEAWAKIELNLPYTFQGGMPGGAHDTAVIHESILLRQRPGFTDYPAGGSLSNLNPR